MKYLERMGRRGGGRPFHSVISTTFAIEFSAFEELMLPQLMASGATNILVIADERMASMVLTDGSRLPVQLGRDYALVSPPVANGLFHPKIVLQVGRKGGRLFVGSANLTAAGLAGNAEAVIEIECGDEPSPEREIIRSAWSYLVELVKDRSRSAKDAVIWASDRAPWLRGADPDPIATLEDGTAVAFLTRGDASGIGQTFLDLIGEASVERLVVASPYWDPDLDALHFLHQGLQPAEISILLDAENNEFPLDATLPSGAELRQLPRNLKGRFAHAKIFIATTEEHDHVLIGSANCTTPALGMSDYSGSNSEACIYRRLPDGGAMEALGLNVCLEQDALDPAKIEAREPTPPIPLEEISSKRPGFFELDGDVLTWAAPSQMAEAGLVRLLDNSGNVVETISFDLGAEISHMSFRISTARRSVISFAVVEADGFISNRAYVTQRSVLQSRRREIASGAVARAIEVFDENADFELWMHQAFDELARADLIEKSHPATTSARAPQGPRTTSEESSTRFFTYEEFMETRKPDARSEGRENSLSGTHSDRIRQFMNELVGQANISGEEDTTEGDEDWLDIGDENEDTQLKSETERAELAGREKPEQPLVESWVDAKQFEKMVDLYIERLTSGDEPLGPADVLRVRFWLMMLLHKARTTRLPHGLEASISDRGWPRMAFRIVSSFFCGRRPPVTRLMIACEYTEMPADFLECWATVLWTLDAIEAALPPSPRNEKFLHFVPRVRAEVAKILGLTAAELRSDTVLDLRSAMDRTVGARLFDVAIA